MKTRKKRITELRERIIKNNMMQRFIREIEREEYLEEHIVQSMMAYQLQVIR
jgi:hypothetical protein